MLPLRPLAPLAAAAALALALASPEPARAGHRSSIVHHAVHGLYPGHGRPQGFTGHHRRHLVGHHYGYWHDHGRDGALGHWLRHGSFRGHGWRYGRHRVRHVWLHDGAHHHHAHGHGPDCAADQPAD